MVRIRNGRLQDRIRSDFGQNLDTTARQFWIPKQSPIEPGSTQNRPQIDPKGPKWRPEPPGASPGPLRGPFWEERAQMTETRRRKSAKVAESRRKSPQRGPKIDPKSDKNVDDIRKRMLDAVLPSPGGAFLALGRVGGTFVTMLGDLGVYFGVHFGPFWCCCPTMEKLRIYCKKTYRTQCRRVRKATNKRPTSEPKTASRKNAGKQCARTAFLAKMLPRAAQEESEGLQGVPKGTQNETEIASEIQVRKSYEKKRTGPSSRDPGRHSRGGRGEVGRGDPSRVRSDISTGFKRRRPRAAD